MAQAPSAMVAMPIGTLIQKIHSQDTCWVSRPPSTGPTARASAPTPPQTPTAAFRSRGSVKVALMIASVVGVTSAAPTPWRARAAISAAAPPAKPGEQRGHR